MHVVTAEFWPTEGNRDALIKRLRQQASDSLGNEPDCHVFDVCIDQNDPDCILLYEVYSDPGAFAHHLETDHFQAFASDTETLVADKHVRQFDRLTA